MVEFLNGSDDVRLAFLYCLCDVGHIALHLLVVVGLYCVKKHYGGVKNVRLPVLMIYCKRPKQLKHNKSYEKTHPYSSLYGRCTRAVGRH